MRMCKKTRPCSEHEFCYAKLGVCIPKLIRRRYTSKCDQESHCLLNEICDRGQCVSKKDKVPCEFRGQCKANEICVSGYCVKFSCTGKRCFNVDNMCMVDSDCNGTDVCMKVICLDPVPITCKLSTDCESHETCMFGFCKESQCEKKSDCREEEECLHRRCISLQQIILTRLCETNDHCFEGEECKREKCIAMELVNKEQKTTLSTATSPLSLTNQKTGKKASTNPTKALKNNKEILPKNFLCDCEEGEDCVISDCSEEQKNRATSKTASRASSVNLKDIIKELLKEEENKLLFEISNRKQLTEDKKVKVYQRKLEETDERKILKSEFNAGIKNLLPSAVSFLKESSTINDNLRKNTNTIKNDVATMDKSNDQIVEYGENCINDGDCSNEKCCVLGVCVKTDDCLLHQHDQHTIAELKDTLACLDDSKCSGDGLICHLGYCKPDRHELKQNEIHSTCSSENPCKRPHQACLLGACVHAFEINDFVPCIHNGTRCEDKNRICVMRACVFST